MSAGELLAEVKGVADVVQWFGRWPSFHDAEVVGIELHRRAPSYVRVHAFEITAELDERGYCKLDKHAIVTFVLSNVSELDLIGFNSQNVISGILVERVDGQFRLTLGDCYGVSGSIVSPSIACELQPGSPPDKRYKGASA